MRPLDIVRHAMAEHPRDADRDLVIKELEECRGFRSGYKFALNGTSPRGHAELRVQSNFDMSKLTRRDCEESAYIFRLFVERGTSEKRQRKWQTDLVYAFAQLARDHKS